MPETTGPGDRIARAVATAAGPDALLAIKTRRLLPCVGHFYADPPQIVAGQGATLFDHRGRAYVDCLSGVGVMNAGHSTSEIIECAIEQIRTLQHTTTIYLTEPLLRLAEALAAIAPPPLERTFFCASGSEAVEGALMIAMQHTRRPLIVAMEGSLHGRTRLAMNATGLAMWRSDPFPSHDVIHVPFGDAAALERALEAHRGLVAAVITEPVQGNGGIVVPPREWLPAVRALASEHGALLVLDEVQTGFNRTGRWFASEHWGIAPDLLATSKALGNGFPIAAVMATDAVAASCTRPAASTYGGNPVCAAAALATIRHHQLHDLGERAALLGVELLSSLRAIALERADLFDEPRGLGLMIGLPVRGGDAASATSAADEGARCDAILEGLMEGGVLAGKTGARRNVLTFMPPLVVTREELRRVTEAVREVSPADHSPAAALATR